MDVSKKGKNEAKPTGRHRRRWTREFKLSVIGRMSEAVSVRALSDELGIRAELLYDWPRQYRSGGASALRSSGRPSASDSGFEVSPPPLPAPAGGEQRRIAELERKIGLQQLELDFVRAAFRHVREARLKKGEPGGTASSR